MMRFHSVTVRMAKRQNLSLNPAKISGMCGRLMCCLEHEVDLYPELRKKRRSD
jgi:cell fate regulator YaaT (PSP1 superfamily)